MSSLFGCDEPSTWRKVHERYWDVVEAKAKVKKTGTLLKLDKWYQEELPPLISSREERHITLPELVKLMGWKLTKGKFRPRLQQLVASNSEEMVEKCSRKAFSLLPDVEAAITELSSLRGVGPATASAVLAAGAPEQAAFMSDEAVESVPGLQPIQYTAKHYTKYLTEMTEQSKKLNEVDPEHSWTPHRLELCLWAIATATKQQMPLLEDIRLKDTNKSRENPNLDCDQRSSKKHKKV